MSALRRGRGAPSRAQQAAAAEFAEFRDTFAGLATPQKLSDLLSGEWLTTAEVLEALGLDRCRAGNTGVAAILVKAGATRLQIGGTHHWTWGANSKAKPPLTEYAPTGPSLMPGSGEKRDCARYGGCLTALAHGAPYATHGHCPAECAHFVEPSRRDALVAAVADVGMTKRGAQWGAW